MRVLFLLLTLISTSALAKLEVRNTLNSKLSIYQPDEQKEYVDIQALDFILNTELESTFDNGVRFFTEITTRYETQDKLEPGKPEQNSSSSINRRWFINDYTDIELREFYFDGYIDNVFIKLGKQQTVWGQSDGVQVLDVVNPMYYREFISDKIETRRIPLWTASVEFPINEWMAQLIWLPDQTYHLYPEQNSEYTITSPKLIPFIDSTQQVLLEQEDKPNQFVKDSDYGVRLTNFINGWDISVNYLYQYNNSLAVIQQHQNNIHKINSEYVRTHLFGASFAKTFGSFSIRGELAYLSDSTPLHNTSTNIVSDNTAEEIKGVVGIDYSGLSDTLLSMQLFTSQIIDMSQYLIRDETEQQLSLLGKRELLNQVLSIEGFLLHSLNDRDGYWHLYVNYKYLSDLSFNIGINNYYGNPSGVFGQFNNASRASFGVSYSF